MRKTLITVSFTLFVCLSACSGTNKGALELSKETSYIKPYSDVRGYSTNAIKLMSNDYTEVISDWPEGTFDPNEIYTLWYNELTVFRGSEDLAEIILEDGKNPGLGVRSIHEQGITGKGVNVAIIDQFMVTNHPEFAGKVIAYEDVDAKATEGYSAMHGVAVTSLLVGEIIGTAPGARVYYAAVPSEFDASYYADALYWIIEQNESLSQSEKIRVVSVSADLDNHFALPEDWDEAVEAAKEAGILVIDASNKTKFVELGYYDVNDPENVSKFVTEMSTMGNGSSEEIIYAPAWKRTTAEEYYEGEASYQYTGEAGLSWAIPYVAGVLALGWEVNPDLNADEIKQILFDSAYVNWEGNKIIDPVSFIEAVKETVK